MDINLLRDRETVSEFTVTELNSYIKNILESNRTLASVTVRGEISNFISHRSGHLYFSLKDEGAQLKCVMFRSSASRLRFMPEDGMKVIVHGSISAYVQGGSYQLYAGSIQPDGKGALYLAYEQLKERLSKEGLFDTATKRPLPKFPSKIGVITAPQGAAVRDIINVTGRRFPMADIYLYPALVQGESCAESLIRGVDFFDRSGLCDVVIIGRGGGSIEDLWGFNSEALARRIYSATVPIVSAVGHETDFTICDFVSDLRAPTPSAAAELVTPDIRELCMRIVSLEERSQTALRGRVSDASLRLAGLDFRRIYSALGSALKDKSDSVRGLLDNAVRAMTDRLNGGRSVFTVLAEKANAFSPLSTLGRGYSVVSREGRVLSSVSEITPGELINVKMSDGSLSATVDSIDKGDENE